MFEAVEVLALGFSKPSRAGALFATGWSDVSCLGNLLGLRVASSILSPQISSDVVTRALVDA